MCPRIVLLRRSVLLRKLRTTLSPPERADIMQRYFVRASCLLVVVCGIRFLWPIAGPDAWRPRLDCKQPVFDFGTISADEVVQARFPLRNTGFQELRIARILPGCTCTVMKEPALPALAPLNSSTITIPLHFEGVRGAIRKPILIESNDPVRPRALVVIEGHIKG